MGVFSVPIKIRNWQNRFFPKDRQGEEIICEAFVDTGAAELALPVDLLGRLKLEELVTFVSIQQMVDNMTIEYLASQKSKSKTVFVRSESSNYLMERNLFWELYHWKRWIGISLHLRKGLSPTPVHQRSPFSRFAD